MYFLLLSRKERQPSVEDEARAPGGGNQRGTKLCLWSALVRLCSVPFSQIFQEKGLIQNVHLPSCSCNEPGEHTHFHSGQFEQVCVVFCRAQSIGSANLDQLPPRSPRLSAAAAPNYSPSAHGYYTYNTATPPVTRVRKVSQAPTDGLSSGSSSTLDPATVMAPPAAAPWKRKLSQTMKHLVVSPRFHRKRYDGSGLESPSAESPVAASPQL